MRTLQVSLNGKQWPLGRKRRVEFVVPDPEILETLRHVHSKIPQAGPAPAGPHALVASLLGHCVTLAAEGSPISTEFRSVLARHVAYHRPIIANHSSTDIGNAANGFEVTKAKEESADAIRQCVGELLTYLA